MKHFLSNYADDTALKLNLLTFNSHLKQLCKNVANSVNTLTRITPYLSHSQRQFIYISFFTRQLSYCPLMWTFCLRQSNYLINKLQGRAFGVTCNDYFSELLKISNESSIHRKNRTVLTTEI